MELKHNPIPATAHAWQRNDAERLRKQFVTDTTERAGVLYWKSNGAPVPMSCFKEAFTDAPAAQQAACDRYTRKAIAQYRKAQAKRTPAEIAEQRAEARAAFGPGETVVNIVTGERYRT